MHKKILIATGSFKDVYTPIESAQIIYNVLSQFVDVNKLECCPLADGGEYSGDVLLTHKDYKRVVVKNVVFADGTLNDASYIVNPQNIAFIFSSEILRILPEKENKMNPLYLTTYGIGQLIKAAIDDGVKEINIGLGGTGTVDGGIGLGQALGLLYKNSYDKEVVPLNQNYFTGIDMQSISHVSIPKGLFNKIKVTALCDADISIKQMSLPISQKISHKFYKNYEEIEKKLYFSLKDLGEKLLNDKLIESRKFLGVAGGILLTLMSITEINCLLGSSFFAEFFSLKDKIRQCDVIITGEGRLDNSFSGKAPSVVAEMAKRADKPCIYIAGEIKGGYTIPEDLLSIITVIDLSKIEPIFESSDSYIEKIDFYRNFNIQKIIYGLKRELEI